MAENERRRLFRRLEKLADDEAYNRKQLGPAPDFAGQIFDASTFEAELEWIASETARWEARLAELLEA